MFVLITYDVNTEDEAEKHGCEKWQNSVSIMDNGYRIPCLNV